MAQSLTNGIHKGSVAVLLSLVCAVAAAQGLPDPTRPPQASAAGMPDTTSVGTGPVVQSIILGKNRAEAIVDGHLVRPGDSVGEAKVARITESEVVLNEHGSLNALKLFPGIEKRKFEGGESVSPATTRKSTVHKK